VCLVGPFVRALDQVPVSRGQVFGESEKLRNSHWSWGVDCSYQKRRPPTRRAVGLANSSPAPAPLAPAVAPRQFEDTEHGGAEATEQQPHGGHPRNQHRYPMRSTGIAPSWFLLLSDELLFAEKSSRV
jgi:hypothetical protein